MCRSLPTPDDPSGGIFVLNRLAAMSGRADVQVMQPLPYLPLVKPLPAWAHAPKRRVAALEVEHRPMFYLPGVLKSLDARWLARSIAPAVQRAHRQAPLDLIDAHFGYPEGAGSARVGDRLGIPTFITIRGFEKEYASKQGIGSQMLTAMRSARGCICVSHSLQKFAIEHGVEPERTRVVHNAIDSGTFHFAERLEARQRLDLAPEAPLIVSVGHLIRRKRHHVLIDALARLRRDVPGATLAIVGGALFEADYPRELEAAVRAQGLGDAVRFLGNMAPAKVVDWLRAADVFALATAREGCCNAVLEALAVGVPVVTTPVGDNAHFVHEGENGFLAPVDDAQALAAALARAFAIRNWDRKLIAARLQAQVGGWDDVAKRVVQFFHDRLER